MRIRTVVAATVIAAGATVSLAGVASASTPTHGDQGGNRAVTCAVATTRAPDAGRVLVTRPVHLTDAKPGWVVDDEGRTLAVEDWAIDDSGRVLSREGTVIAQRGWVVCGENRVIEARPGDCPTGVTGTRVIYAVPAQEGERVEFRAVERAHQN